MKNILFAVLFLPFVACAGDTGFKSPSFNEGQGWQNPENAYVSDDLYATIDGNKKLYGAFEFQIPKTAKITGLEVKIEGTCDLGFSGTPIRVSWSPDAGSSFTAIKNAALLDGGDHTFILGSSTDTWTDHLVVPDYFSHKNFRLAIQGNPLHNCSGEIDQIQAKVYFQDGRILNSLP